MLPNQHLRFRLYFKETCWYHSNKNFSKNLFVWWHCEQKWRIYYFTLRLCLIQHIITSKVDPQSIRTQMDSLGSKLQHRHWQGPEIRMNQIYLFVLMRVWRRESCQMQSRESSKQRERCLTFLMILLDTFNNAKKISVDWNINLWSDLI